MFRLIYPLPLWQIVHLIVIAVFLWTVLSVFFSMFYPKFWRISCILLTVSAVAAIVYLTLLRGDTVKREIILLPFHGFIEAKIQKEMYRSMLMNVFLFVPFGLFMPFALPQKPGKTGRNILLTVLAAVLISVIIETIQYIFRLGRCETDDVICNSLGAFIGSLSYLGSVKIGKTHGK